MADQKTCSTCGHIKLAHTGPAGQVNVVPGAVVHLDQGWCLGCSINHCTKYQEVK